MRTQRIIIIIVLIICGLSATWSQEYEVRFYLGANYYQGDLSPRAAKFSFSPGRLGWAVMAGTKVSEVFKLNLKFMTGQIGGDDSDANNDSRRVRNLSFDSPIYEFGVNTEININHFLPFLNKYGINIYYTTGINYFNFSPKTALLNSSGDFILVDLQPIGTEGQGLTGYKDRYALNQINIPFGFGMKFQLFENIEIGFELVPRMTFTDYLDDVSGVYLDKGIFLDNNRILAAQLSNRTGEYLGTDPIDYPEGTLRGNPEDNDWYFFGAAFISYNFGKGYVPKKLIKSEDVGIDQNMQDEPNMR
ncbi:MAG: DUF6089 family protein [Saprospiraceae bacterium]|nr:DUF6089 family protein [Saprospiraceae bacterium]